MEQRDAALLDWFRSAPRTVIFDAGHRERLIFLGQRAAMENELLAWCRDLPKSENAQIRLARFYVETNRTGDALATLDGARPLLGTNPFEFDDRINFVPDTLFMAKQYELAKRYDDAIAVLKQGRQHMPTKPGLELQTELDRIVAATGRPH